MKLLILFIVLNIINVILQTIKSLATVKCGKLAAAAVNALAYGLYTIVIIYTNCDLNLWAKVAIVAITNLIGVYVVKALEEKVRKDKLWKVEATVPNEFYEKNEQFLNEITVPHNYIPINGYKIVNFYCNTQKESEQVKAILNVLHAKYFVSESKIL